MRTSVDRLSGILRPEAIRGGAAALLAVAVVIGAATMLARGGQGPGFGILVAGVAIATGLLALLSPVSGVMVLLAASFFRTAVPVKGLPAEPFTLAFLAVVAGSVWAVLNHRSRGPRVGNIELAMLLYLLWNIGSWVAPHDLGPIDPINGTEISIYRFILTGVLVPFAMFVIGRTFLTGDGAVRMVLWSIVGFSAMSAVVSMGQRSGIDALYWPRFIDDASSTWVERAVGVFNQPVVNGMVLTVGFMTCLYVATFVATSRFQRVLVGVVAVLSAFGVYLTITRVVWLAFLVVLVLGALFATRFRTGFVLPLACVPVLAAVFWTTLTGGDRAEGGVGSVNEVDDRLNNAATALWAVQEKPFAGWGIARFTAVNTYYHQRWSDDVPWTRGYGYSSHENELGIATELGLIGLLLWLVVVGLVVRRLVVVMRDARSVVDMRQYGLAFVAFTSVLVWISVGFTNDLRYFDFANCVVMLLAGMTIGLHGRARRSGTSGRTARPVTVYRRPENVTESVPEKVGV